MTAFFMNVHYSFQKQRNNESSWHFLFLFIKSPLCKRHLFDGSTESWVSQYHPPDIDSFFNFPLTSGEIPEELMKTVNHFLPFFVLFSKPFHILGGKDIVIVWLFPLRCSMVRLKNKFEQTCLIFFCLVCPKVICLSTTAPPNPEYHDTILPILMTVWTSRQRRAKYRGR